MSSIKKSGKTALAAIILWGYTSEAAHRFWDEMTPPPTRAVATRLTVTYAGFEGESDLLWALYQRGLQGTEIAPDLYAQPGMLMYWSHAALAPWQTPEWLESMRRTVRPNAYLRMYENRWVSSDSPFIALEAYDACEDAAARPVVADPSLGIDASLKHDATAIVWVTWDADRKTVRLVGHRIFQPSPEQPLDFEATIEATVLELRER